MAGQLEEKVAPYSDCVLRYNVQKSMEDMYFATYMPDESPYRRNKNGLRHEYIMVPASMVFNCLLYHPRSCETHYSSVHWVEQPAMRIGVCMIDKFVDAETRPLFHINSVNPGHVDHQQQHEGFPLLDVMLTQHMHKLWTPVTEWLAQNVYVPGG
jgi:hypothetical protein